MNDSPWRRPKSLREVAESSRVYGDFGYHLKDFLHEVSEARRRGASLQPMLAEEPPMLAAQFHEGGVCDAFAAGLADWLARESGIPTPAWALAESRKLERPWFSPEFPQVRMRLLRDTPSAFKDKNIFIFESAFQVA